MPNWPVEHGGPGWPAQCICMCCSIICASAPLEMAVTSDMALGGFARRLSDLSIEVDVLEALERRAL